MHLEEVAERFPWQSGRRGLLPGAAASGTALERGGRLYEARRRPPEPEGGVRRACDAAGVRGQALRGRDVSPERPGAHRTGAPRNGAVPGGGAVAAVAGTVRRGRSGAAAILQHSAGACAGAGR
ncbi:hypothetical protein G6F65_020784 [Rhizopus arrhizus]|nr:hypothetical protein G6F65_020784 [Rhizopus arrhizus]